MELCEPKISGDQQGGVAKSISHWTEGLGRSPTQSHERFRAPPTPDLWRIWRGSMAGVTQPKCFKLCTIGRMKGGGLKNKRTIIV
jgi:hypothetical protein